MKFRKTLLALKLWRRATIARRELTRLKHKLKEKERLYNEEKKELVLHYESLLAFERTAKETLHIAWADRFLQLQNLSSTGFSTSLVQEKAALQLSPQLKTKTQEDPLTGLSAAQHIEFLDRKTQFFQDGIVMDKSPAEIAARWEQIQADVIDDVKFAIN